MAELTISTVKLRMWAAIAKSAMLPSDKSQEQLSALVSELETIAQAAELRDKYRYN